MFCLFSAFVLILFNLSLVAVICSGASYCGGAGSGPLTLLPSRCMAADPVPLLEEPAQLMEWMIFWKSCPVFNPVFVIFAFINPTARSAAPWLEGW